MKNNLLYMVMGISVAFVFWGCSDDNSGDAQQEQVPAVIMGKAYSFDPEDMGEQWKSGKTVGIYMLKENTTECVVPYYNVKYQTTVEPQGYFTPINKDEVIYYPQDGNKVDVIAYYPWKENQINELYPINVANQKTVSNFSFLYAGNGKGLSKDNNKVSLQFRPVLSQIIFRLEAGDGVTDIYLTESAIKISGMNTKANFNLLSGIFEQESEPKDVDLLSLEEENGASGQVLPAISTEGYEAEIVLPKMGRTYSWKLSEKIELLKPGMRYICSVRVDLDKIDVETSEEPIEDWKDGDKHEVAGEENNIQTAIDELPLGVWTKVEDAMKVPMNTWCHQEYNGGIRVEVEMDEKLGRNIVHANVSIGGTWYRNFVAYRMGGAKAQVYTLKFRAKGKAGDKINCYIRTNETTAGGRNSNLFVLKELSGGKYTGGAVSVLSDDYQEYSFDFDFSKMIENISGHQENELLDVTPTALSDFYIAFYAMTSGMDFYLDDVILKKQN